MGDVETAAEEVQGGWARTAKDLGSGAAGGVAQVLIGQPFDIIKVRLQTTTKYAGALDCGRQILAHEGPLAFYKGTLTPLIGIGACVSVQFGAFHWARRKLEARNAAAAGTGSNAVAAAAALSYPQYALAGAVAGLANTPLSTPIEHVRIRLQTQPHGAARLYRGPLDCMRQLGVRGLYRGVSVTSMREAIAYGAWFLTFELAMQGDARRNHVARNEIPAWKVALYGGIAGEMLWLSSYPFDVVKSKMQTDGFGAQRQYRSWLHCAGRVWAVEGARGFWKGIGPTLARAMPVSAGTFAVVEATMRALG